MLLYKPCYVSNKHLRYVYTKVDNQIIYDLTSDLLDSHYSDLELAWELKVKPGEKQTQKDRKWNTISLQYKFLFGES